jgi:hypothetical protein
MTRAVPYSESLIIPIAAIGSCNSRPSAGHQRTRAARRRRHDVGWRSARAEQGDADAHAKMRELEKLFREADNSSA